MTRGYGADLAVIHDAGFGAFARAAAPAIVALLRRRGLGRGARVVEFGCGSGIGTRILSRAGFDVVGIDRSSAMIALARRRAPLARFVRGSFVDAAIPPCDAIVAIGEVFNYVIDPRHGAGGLARLFRRCRAALRGGGVLVFDALVVDRSRAAAAEFGRTGKDWAIVGRRTVDRGGRRLVREMTTFRRLPNGAWRRGHETISAAIFEAAAVERALAAAGFRGERCRGYGRKALSRGHAVFVGG